MSTNDTLVVVYTNPNPLQPQRLKLIHSQQAGEYLLWRPRGQLTKWKIVAGGQFDWKKQLYLAA